MTLKMQVPQAMQQECVFLCNPSLKPLAHLSRSHWDNKLQGQGFKPKPANFQVDGRGVPASVSAHQRLHPRPMS